MEFIIGNLPFSQAEKLDDTLYYQGHLEKYGDLSILSEGYIFDPQFQNIPHYCSAGLKEKDASGIYNIFCYHARTKELIFKNDKRGTLPVYTYQKGQEFLFSNNVWKIVEIVQNNTGIRLAGLKEQLCHITELSPTLTLFENIFRQESATLFIYKRGNIFRKRYWNFTYTPEGSLKPETAIEELDASLKSYFSFIHRENGEKIMGFGNSGGLDSRLIAHYALQEKIPTEAFIIARLKPHGILKATSPYISEKIARLYDFNSRIIEYSSDKLKEHFLLDIRNAPFTSSQIFINPYTKLNFFDYEMTGEPGGIIYMPPACNSNIPEDLLKHANYFLGFRKFSLPSVRTFFRNSFLHLKIPFDVQANEGFTGLKHSVYSKIILSYDPKEFTEHLASSLNELGGENNVERWVRIHDNITTKYAYNGGYESVSGLYRSYYLYYPCFYEKMQYYPLEFFHERKLAKAFILKINPDLGKIANQNLQMPYPTSRLYKLYKALEMGLRGRGLNYDYMLHSPEYKKLAKDILERDNPLFYSVVNKQLISGHPFLYTFAGTTLIKLKLLTDIFYYKEWDLLKNDRFQLANW
ncbi:hypothetical protein [Culturomica massiliensis]|uniref:hypothetical protein n=1 Tax=Culturomica massiliensis TaxID=1841857 RepID=UPI000837E049|nr:hypothetical protein [Culturomica massiliensis]